MKDDRVDFHDTKSVYQFNYTRDGNCDRNIQNILRWVSMYRLRLTLFNLLNIVEAPYVD